MTSLSLSMALAATGLLVLPSATRTARLRRLMSGTDAIPRGVARACAVVAARGQPVCAGVVVAVLVAAAGGTLTAVPVALAAGGLAWFGVKRLLARRATRTGGASASLRLAATGDLLAACLHAGMPVPTAVRAVADTAPPPADGALRTTAELLALGAEPAEAWEPVRRCAGTAELARAACRTARSGSALAEVAIELAARARSGVADEAEAAAQRAGVLITGPLGLCFLPAFLCLGVIPVVVGLASRLTLLT